MNSNSLRSQGQNVVLVSSRKFHTPTTNHNQINRSFFTSLYMVFLLLEGEQFYNQRWLLGNKISGIDYVGGWRWWASFILYPYSPRFLSHWKKVCGWVGVRAHECVHTCVLLTEMDIVVQTVISALGNLRQEDYYDLKGRQGYNRRPHLTKNKRKKKGKNLLLTANGKAGFIHLQKLHFASYCIVFRA